MEVRRVNAADFFEKVLAFMQKMCYNIVTKGLNNVCQITYGKYLMSGRIFHV